MGKIKILRYLTNREEMNITTISKTTKLNHTRVKNHLDDLRKLGIVMEKKFGRIRIYKINDIDEPGRKVKEFLRYW